MKDKRIVIASMTNPTRSQQQLCDNFFCSKNKSEPIRQKIFDGQRRPGIPRTLVIRRNDSRPRFEPAALRFRGTHSDADADADVDFREPEQRLGATSGSSAELFEESELAAGVSPHPERFEDREQRRRDGGRLQLRRQQGLQLQREFCLL